MEQFDYSFSVWPSETWTFEKSVFTLFECMKGRVKFTFTEREFEMFRSSVGHSGFTLREIERVPYSEPESIL